MAKLLFRLRNVPEDEAEEVRELLQSNDIEHYETKGGNWGISMPGIWVRHDTDLERAKALLADYQSERAERARQELAERQERGEAPTQVQMLLDNPAKALGVLVVVGAILYISISTFFRF